MRGAKRDFETYRRTYLPIQLEATRRKLDALIKEAKRLGMEHLLEPGE